MRQFIATMIKCTKRNMNEEVLTDVDRWKMVLGSMLTNNKPYEKGVGLLKTFIVSLDHITATNIKKLVGGTPKQTIFSVVRWIFFDFNDIISRADDLSTKRLRLGEYLVSPIIYTVYNKLYRYLSTSETSKNIETCSDILKIKSNILIGAISGKNRSAATSLNIAKYSSYVNDESVLTVATKFTTAGPGSPIEKSGKRINIKFRLFDPSYVGKICIITASNSEPGVSGSLTPFVKINPDTLTFE